MKVSLLRYRRAIVVVLHLALTVLSYLLAYVLRFDGNIPDDQLRPLLMSLPLLLLVRTASFWGFQLYEGLWRYASLVDLQKIILSVATSSLVF